MRIGVGPVGAVTLGAGRSSSTTLCIAFAPPSALWDCVQWHEGRGDARRPLLECLVGALNLSTRPNPSAAVAATNERLNFFGKAVPGIPKKWINGKNESKGKGARGAELPTRRSTEFRYSAPAAAEVRSRHGAYFVRRPATVAEDHDSSLGRHNWVTVFRVCRSICVRGLSQVYLGARKWQGAGGTQASWASGVPKGWPRGVVPACPAQAQPWRPRRPDHRA